MKKITLFLILITAFVSAQNTKVARSITGSSSIESTSNSFQMKGTLGQQAQIVALQQQIDALKSMQANNTQSDSYEESAQ